MVRDMSDSYVISKDDPFQFVKDIEKIENEYFLTEFENSLSLDLDDPGRNKRVEQRCLKRFHLKENAYALVRSIADNPLNIQGKSMGSIACEVFNSEPARLGKIDNISMGGLMFKHIAGKRKLNRTFTLDILSVDCRFYLSNITFKIEADIILPEETAEGVFEMRQVRIQFQDLSTNQQARLKNFLHNHAREIES